MLKDQNGSTLLLAVDYSPYTNDGGSEEHESVICFAESLPVREVQSIYGPAPSCLMDSSGCVKGIWLKLHQQECALIRL